MRRDEELSCRYRRTFGAAPSPTDDEEVLVNVAKILAAFQETFETRPRLRYSATRSRAANAVR